MSCEETFYRQLRERGFRLTPQREMVLSVLHEIDGLATADDIYDRVSAISSSVNMSTVYRTLELLQDFHLVASVDPGDGERRYEHLGLQGPHLHLVCRSCGKAIGVDPGEIQPLMAHLKQKYGFEVDLARLSIPGLCRDCSVDRESAPTPDGAGLVYGD